eukprot:g8948.t1
MAESDNENPSVSDDSKDTKTSKGSFPAYKIPDRPLTFLILGGEHDLRSHFIKQAMDAGHKVVALVHNKADVTDQGAELTVMEAPLTDATALEKGMQGADAVVALLEFVPKAKGEEADTLTDTVKRIVGSMRKANLWRLLVLGNDMLELKGTDTTSSLSRKLTAISGRAKLKEEQEMADYLSSTEASDINWSLLRLGKRDPKADAESQGYPVVLDVPFHSAITLVDCAALCLRLLATEKTLPLGPFPGYDYVNKGHERWIADDCSNECTDCDKRFTMMIRRTHCRKCGFVLCAKCGGYGKGGWKICTYCDKEPIKGRDLCPKINLKLQIKGLKNNEGDLLIAATRHQNHNKFLSFDESKADWFRKVDLRDAVSESVDGKTKYSVSIEIPNFDAGFFAVSGVHDEDSTGKLNGIMEWKHGLCASKNGFLRAVPKYGDCSLYVNKDTTLEMIMRYSAA